MAEQSRTAEGKGEAKNIGYCRKDEDSKLIEYKIEILEEIGSGAFSQVHRGKWSKPGRTVDELIAIKITDRNWNLLMKSVKI